MKLLGRTSDPGGDAPSSPPVPARPEPKGDSFLSRTQLVIAVRYASPAHNCRRVLRVLPQSRPGQIVRVERWTCRPDPDLVRERTDELGNRRLLLWHRRIAEEFRFDLETEVATFPGHVPLDRNRPLEPFLRSTPLADWPPPVMAMASAARRQFRGSYWRMAEHLNQLAHESLRYTPNPLPEPLPVSRTLEAEMGSCQDFAHLHLALCRAANLPARYVAGFNPAEGLMHAWTEVLIGKEWIGFDPTHGRAPSPGCVVVSVGRDFRYARTVSGIYHGGEAVLTMRCRTEVVPVETDKPASNPI